jgi:hypothetical protein
MRAKIPFILFFASLMLFSGCAANRHLQRLDGQKWKSEDIVARYLNRWSDWKSLKSHLKVTLSTGDSTFSAKGHLFYLLGERYEIGFAPPYNTVLGTLYLTPEQIVYWDLQISPRVYGIKDTVILSELFPIRMPNWDPRDMLPLPVGGRNGGFQTDSVWYEGPIAKVKGTLGSATYILDLSQEDGIVLREKVLREGRDPIFKDYSGTRSYSSWPISKRVVCQDSTGAFRIAWSLSGISLESIPFRSTIEKTNSQDAGSQK